MDELSIDSLLSVAIAIETNGAEYYRDAADIAPAEMRDEFLLFAEVEDKHAKKFESMKNDLAEDNKKIVRLELTEQQEKYFQCIVNNAAFITPGAAPKLTGNETMGELLKNAIDDEKDTIVFYQCLRNAIKDDKLVSIIGLIIDEELGHMFELTSRLEAM